MIKDKGARHQASRFGVVVIGRNEFRYLRKCLESIRPVTERVVYVDSGSTDGSIKLAESLGVLIVSLDMSLPFTAGRARNEGLACLRKKWPEIDFVQFVDGDCQIHPDWFDHAINALDRDKNLGAVCGRLRERYPEASIYNRLCDFEWDTPIGPVKACGGNSMMRANLLEQVTGFNPLLIAGEEPELCFRIRAQGWAIRRLDAEMALHDAAITRFSQWWRRSTRSGHAYAEGAILHGRTVERHNIRQVRSCLFWGFIVPAITVVGFIGSWFSKSCLIMLAVVVFAYLSMFVRIYRELRQRNYTIADTLWYALFCILGKLPGCIGVLMCWANRRLRRQTSLIEYKDCGGPIRE